MSLETDIQTAYEEQEAVETALRELEARIRKIDGYAWGLSAARASIALISNWPLRNERLME